MSYLRCYVIDGCVARIVHIFTFMTELVTRLNDDVIVFCVLVSVPTVS